jgi:hypothetical protein
VHKTNQNISSPADLSQFDEEKVEKDAREHEHDLPKAEKSNFVENVKTFLAKRFSLKSTCSETKPANETSTNQATSPLHSYALQNESCANRKGSSSSRLTSIESYQRIIEDYKECLPKDFTIRHFPHSSCSDTFEKSNTTVTSSQSTHEINEKLNDLKFGDQQRDELMSCASTHSSSQFTTFSNVCSTTNKSSFDNLESSQTVDFSSKLNTQLNQNVPESNACVNRTNMAQENSSNQRFYHVFKRNELDNLIQTHCANLVIYNSYYDHGNWCICAKKIHS